MIEAVKQPTTNSNNAPQNQMEQTFFGATSYNVVKRNENVVDFDKQKILDSIKRASIGFENAVDINLIFNEFIKNIFNKISTIKIEDALILGVTSLIEKDPAYNYVAARLLLQKSYKEAIGKSVKNETLNASYKEAFKNGIHKAIDLNIADKKLLDFNLEELANALVIERDNIFGYLGLQTLYGRYFLKKDSIRFELPQAFWMRVAMGLSLNEVNKEESTIKFYNVLSMMRFISSTPTLLHSGLTRPQLSSCYLTTIKDDLEHIFKCLADNAALSKWSGGVANDWTNLRATGSTIKSINIESQGIIPFLKIANDVTVAISRSGKRRGATVAYLETWHLDIEDFLDLRRNTGDERRRAHDMNFANWIPDLFIKRVINDEDWTLFSPDEVSDLHHIYGKKFDEKYLEYEQKTKTGEIKLFKVISASALWKKMLTRLFETGYAWITFKDPCNIRSPQDHVGVVHSSNLCTEITLNTSQDETAVCNLGSVNLEKHVSDGKFNEELFEETINTAMQMLDNVIDINFYPTKEAKNSNMRHRPVGLGMMGFQDALFKLNINYDSQEILEFTDNITEKFSYYAIFASSRLAKERGAYETYKGSKWDRGIFPIDTLDLLEKERGIPVEVSRSSKMNWIPVREHVKTYGMRNSNTMAIAPTATIANIGGCYPCIEAMYSNIYVKSNMIGEFVVINFYLVEDLKKANLWDEDMIDQIKFYDGNIQPIERMPDVLKKKYKGAFDLDPEWMIKVGALRSKWIDQSISHNVFMKGISGKKLNDTYLLAWRSGIKTMYYLRTLAASQIEKSTLDAKKFGYTQKRDHMFIPNESNVNDAAKLKQEESKEQEFDQAFNKECSISQDPDCEVCQ